MRIAYFDEAGIASEAQEPYLVVAGVAIHGDTEWHPIETHANEIIKTLVPAELRAGFVFHATDLFSGNDKKFKKLLLAENRFQILREVLEIIAQFKLPVSYGAVDRMKLVKRRPTWKPKQRTTFAHQAAFNLCAHGLQGWFNREHGDEVAICVADRNVEMELTLKQDFASQRRAPLPAHPLLMLFNFVDALHFANLYESIGLQLADSAAFVVKRHLMGKEDTADFYEIIKPQLVCEPESALLFH